MSPSKTEKRSVQREPHTSDFNGSCGYQAPFQFYSSENVPATITKHSESASETKITFPLKLIYVWQLTENNNKSKQLPACSPAQLLSKIFGKGNSNRGRSNAWMCALWSLRWVPLKSASFQNPLLFLETKLKNNQMLYTVHPRWNFNILGTRHLNYFYTTTALSP